MTVSGPGEQITAELAEALGKHQKTRGMSVSMGWTCACGWWTKDASPLFIVAHQAEAAAATVEAYATRKAAEALRDAAADLADDDESDPAYIAAAALLTARADALTATHTDHGKATR